MIKYIYKVLTYSIIVEIVYFNDIFFMQLGK